jgi:hypothetical protein
MASRSRSACPSWRAYSSTRCCHIHRTEVVSSRDVKTAGELLDWQKEFNIQVNKIRWVIEQVISHFKNWRIMHTDDRCPIDTFATTISAVIGLHFYRMA